MGLTYPSNKICPQCGTGGYVWYLDNSEYVAKCINCNHYFRKDDFPMCVLDGAPKPTNPCPYCGGWLSEIREHKNKKYRHCYACHMEFHEGR